MSKKWIIIVFILAVLLGLSFLIGPVMSQVEQPKYEVRLSAGDIEIRQYAPMIIAELEIKGKRDEAIREGFRFLASYIFGKNTLASKIPMTAPVQEQSAGDEKWKISFIMPSKYTMETLPQPNNKEIKLKNIPEKQYVVLRFSGLYSDENLANHEKHLIEYIEKNHLKTLKLPKYAFYNPPWTLPFMRRNEILFEISR